MGLSGDMWVLESAKDTDIYCTRLPAEGLETEFFEKATKEDRGKNMGCVCIGVTQQVCGHVESKVGVLTGFT